MSDQNDLLPILCQDMVEAVCDRPHEPEARRRVRATAAMHTLRAMEPRDAVEAMFAGQVVVFQSLMVDSVRESHLVETGQEAYRHRAQVVAMSRIQLSYLKEIRLHRAERYPAVEAEPEPAVVEEALPPPVTPAASVAEAEPAPPRAEPERSVPPAAAAPVVALPWREPASHVEQRDRISPPNTPVPARSAGS